jgi:low affinity Fe/Cu permease
VLLVYVLSRFVLEGFVGFAIAIIILEIAQLHRRYCGSAYPALCALAECDSVAGAYTCGGVFTIETWWQLIVYESVTVIVYTVTDFIRGFARVTCRPADLCFARLKTETGAECILALAGLFLALCGGYTTTVAALR